MKVSVQFCFYYPNWGCGFSSRELSAEWANMALLPAGDEIRITIARSQDRCRKVEAAPLRDSRGEVRMYFTTYA